MGLQLSLHLSVGSHGTGLSGPVGVPASQVSAGGTLGVVRLEARLAS